MVMKRWEGGEEVSRVAMTLRVLRRQQHPSAPGQEQVSCAEFVAPKLSFATTKG